MFATKKFPPTFKVSFSRIIATQHHQLMKRRPAKEIKINKPKPIEIFST